MDEGSPDIVAKYQKLASEYSKLRAQVSVLKKAVSDEQGKNYEIKEALKEKDQCVRKLEQEVECLNFRNLQLTKRISVLQNDLEATEEKAKKAKSKTQNYNNSVSTSSEAESILNTELLSRIGENEKLHQQVFEAEIEHKKIASDLTSKVEHLEFQLSQQHGSLSETIKKHEETITKLSQERAKFELTQKNFERNIKDVKSKDEICKQELEFVKQDLGTKLKEANEIIQEKVRFHNTRWPNFNNLNVPVLLNRNHKLQTSLLVELKGIVSELVHRLSNLHTYMEQKILDDRSDPPTGPVNKLAFLLHDNCSYLKAIETSFEEFYTKIAKDSSAWLEQRNFEGISTSFSTYVRYLDKLLPYLLLSIEEEDNQKGTTSRLKENYQKLQVTAQSVTISFRKLEKYLALLVEIGCSSNSVVYHVSSQVLVKKIIASLHSIKTQFDDAMKVFGAKVLIDHDLPNVLEKSKITDNCILTSMASISTGLKRMCTILEDRISIFDRDVPYIPRNGPNRVKFSISPCVSDFQEKGRWYMSLLQRDEPASIPQEVAIKNSQTLKSYADSRETLAQQLQTCQSKLSKLELDKEYWMVECQLLKTKQARMSPSSSSNNSCSSPDSDLTFQLFIKSSVNQLVTQIQLADSKSLAFQNECECLYQKLKLSDQKCEELEKDNSVSRDTILSLREEQRTLMKNYEDQLSTMSEHLATMNETLTHQKDEIDALKLASNTKPTKKGKGK